MLALEQSVALSTSVHSALESALHGTGELDPNNLLTNLKTFHHLLQRAQREHAEAIARFTAELDCLRSEMHCELVDREANAARISERQRFLFERQSAQPGQLTAAERAAQSAAYVEAALAALCPHSTPLAPGCEQLARVHKERTAND